MHIAVGKSLGNGGFSGHLLDNFQLNAELEHDLNSDLGIKHGVHINHVTIKHELLENGRCLYPTCK